MLSDEGFKGHPYWPGGRSGVTLDYGDDIGADRLPAFTAHWGHLLAPADFALLTGALGLLGESAHQYLDVHQLGRITITRTMAQHVFTLDSLPEFEADLLRVMPGSEHLGPDAFGALTGLLYNRGWAMADDPADPAHERRTEMRTIRGVVAAYGATILSRERVNYLNVIADQLEAMGHRLWPSASALDTNLRERRHREAALVRRAAALFT